MKKLEELRATHVRWLHKPTSNGQREDSKTIVDLIDTLNEMRDHLKQTKIYSACEEEVEMECNFALNKLKERWGE